MEADFVGAAVQQLSAGGMGREAADEVAVTAAGNMGAERTEVAFVAAADKAAERG